MPDQVPFFKPADDVTVYASVILTGGHFVDVSAAAQADGSYTVAKPAAGSHPLAVIMRDAAIGDKVLTMSEGILPVEAGADLTAGQEVMTDANGKAIPWVWAANGANYKAGKVMTDAANTTFAQIKVSL